MSIRSKYLLIFSSLLIVVCVILGISSYLNSTSALKSVTQPLMQELAKTSANVIDKTIEQRYIELTDWSNNELIKDKNASLEDKLDLLISLKEEYGYMGVVIGGMDGIFYSDRGEVMDLTEDANIISAYNGVPSISPPIILDLETGESIVSIAVPYYDNAGNMLGALVGVKDGSALSEISNTIEIGTTGIAFIIDENGTVIAHKELERVVNQENVFNDLVENPKLQAFADLITKAINSDTAGIGEYTYDGKNKYAAFAPINGTSWTLIMAVPKYEILSSLNTLGISTIIISVIVLVAGFVVIFFVTNGLVKRIKHMSNAITVMGDGDFRLVQEKEQGLKDELGIALTSLHKMRTDIGGIIRTIHDKSDQLISKSTSFNKASDELNIVFENVSLSVEETNKGIYSQAESLMNTSHTMKDFGNKIDEVVNNITNIDASSKDISDLSVHGNEEMNVLIEAIRAITESFQEFSTKVEDLGTSIGQITDITKMINDIAEQTNLLALNAAIEAARAGESGKGFSVVAEEIRKLAEQSKKSSSEIDTRIHQISDDARIMIMSTGEMHANLGKQETVVNSTIEAYAKIVNAIDGISNEISNASDLIQLLNKDKTNVTEQIEDASAVSEEVSSTSDEIASSTRQVLVTTESIAQASVEMNDMVQEMYEQVKKFQVD